jgi:hypothetical protein
MKYLRYQTSLGKFVSDLFTVEEGCFNGSPEGEKDFVDSWGSTLTAAYGEPLKAVIAEVDPAGDSPVLIEHPKAAQKRAQAQQAIAKAELEAEIEAELRAMALERVMARKSRVA